DLLAHDLNFRTDLTGILSAATYSAFRWETPPVNSTCVGRPFEFVLLDSPYLAAIDAEPAVFGHYFEVAPHGIDVLPIPTLGKTAILVVPRQLGEPRTYGHLAAFVRGAPESQIHHLWQCVAETVRSRLSAQPIWLSTAGGGVAWLHVRVEAAPKY